MLTSEISKRLRTEIAEGIGLYRRVDETLLGLSRLGGLFQNFGVHASQGDQSDGSTRAPSVNQLSAEIAELIEMAWNPEGNLSNLDALRDFQEWIEGQSTVELTRLYRPLARIRQNLFALGLVDEFSGLEERSRLATLVADCQNVSDTFQLVNRLTGEILDDLQRTRNVWTGPGSVETLELVLNREMSLDQISQKLQAVARIYDGIARLLDKPPASAGTHVVKVESGSLGLEIVGDPEVLAILVPVITSAAIWLQRQFTGSGRISKLAAHREEAERVLDLRNKLSEVGINVDSMDEDLSHIGGSIAHQLDSLLAGEARVDVNGDVTELSGDLAQEMEAASQMALPPGDDESTASDPG